MLNEIKNSQHDKGRDSPPSSMGAGHPIKHDSNEPNTDHQSRPIKSLKTALKWANLPLPAKLLLLTAAFVMLAEILIFVPSVANYRVNWMSDRINDATLAALAADVAPDGQVPLALRKELLQTAGVKAVAWRRHGRRELILPPDKTMFVDVNFDIRPNPNENVFGAISTRLGLISEAVSLFFIPKNRTVRIVGPLGDDPKSFIEVVIPEAPLRDAMLNYGLNILVLSIIISFFTAALVYLALSSLLVRPMIKLTNNMLHYGENPEDASRIITPSNRTDEIGTAERELEAMQRQLTGLLFQKNRLAQLGLAVSKINHDLRNMLANAQLISDRLSEIPDPTVQRFAPKLIASLDRAINFCTNTLQFGRAEEDAPRRDLTLLKPIVNDVADGLGLVSNASGLKWEIDIPNTLHIDADPAHLHRILTNLCRNARQALESNPPQEGGKIHIKAWREKRRVIIELRDNGPGIPQKDRENLFQAFQSTHKKGGSGLGLAIAHELTAAHGGRLEFLETDRGAAFRLDIPDRGTS